jgi:hypothetical protein
MSKKIIRLNELLQEEALWWNPETPDEHVTGTLICDPEDGTTLSLMGTLGEPTSLFSGPEVEPDVIHGITRQGRLITLFGCMRTSFQANMPGIATEKFKAHWALFGGHFKNIEEPTFAESWAHFDGIEDWLGHRPFHSEWKNSQDFSLAVNAIEESPLGSIDNGKVVSRSNIRTIRDNPTKWEIVVESAVGVISETPQNLIWHFSNSSKIRTLASVCAGWDLPIRHFQLTTLPLDRGDGVLEPKRVDVFVQLTKSSSDAERLRKSRTMMVTAPTLLECRADAVRAWYEINRPAIGLYFTLTGSAIPYLESRFLFSVQSLEVFDRIDRPTSEADFKANKDWGEKILTSLPSDVPEKLHEKLQGFLKYSAEPNLSQRLKAIVGGMPAEFGKCPFGIDKKAIRSIVESRNHYTHYSDAAGGPHLRRSDLHWATRRLVALMNALLLTRIGATSEVVYKGMAKHREFSELITSTGIPPSVRS